MRSMRKHTGSGVDKVGLLSTSANHTMSQSPQRLVYSRHSNRVPAKKVQDALFDLPRFCVCVHMFLCGSLLLWSSQLW